MKLRTGFVSNSSSTSFTCDICGITVEGYDGSADGMVTCDYGHGFCEDHIQPIEPKKPTREEAMEYITSSFDAKAIKHMEIDIEKPLDQWSDEQVFHIYNNDHPEPEFPCPICNFLEFCQSELCTYLLKTRGVSRESVFAKIKQINKRRRKLYDGEYITDVCQQFNLTEDILLTEVKEKFKNHKEFLGFIRNRQENPHPCGGG